MDGKGANTFPFHNCLPYSESNEGLFLFFSPSLYWIKEKSMETLAIRNICDKKKNKKVSSSTVLQNCRLYWGDYLKRGYLRVLDHFIAFCLLCLLYFLRVSWVLYLLGILH